MVSSKIPTGVLVILPLIVLLPVATVVLISGSTATWMRAAVFIIFLVAALGALVWAGAVHQKNKG
jgi:hypothetical protein